MLRSQSSTRWHIQITRRTTVSYQADNIIFTFGQTTFCTWNIRRLSFTVLKFQTERLLMHWRSMPWATNSQNLQVIWISNSMDMKINMNFNLNMKDLPGSFWCGSLVGGLNGPSFKLCCCVLAKTSFIPSLDSSNDTFFPSPLRHKWVSILLSSISKASPYWPPLKWEQPWLIHIFKWCCQCMCQRGADKLSVRYSFSSHAVKSDIWRGRSLFSDDYCLDNLWCEVRFWW